MVPGLTGGMAILREHGSRRRGKENDEKRESRAFRSEQTCHDVPIDCTEGAIEKGPSQPLVPAETAGKPESLCG